MCLQEASVMKTGAQLICLFATILAFCILSEPSRLLDEFKQHICDDLRHQCEIRHNMQDPVNDQVNDFGLFLLDKIFLQARKSLALCPDMPLVIGGWEVMVRNRFIAEQRDDDAVQEQEQADEDIARLNKERCMMRYCTQC